MIFYGEKTVKADIRVKKNKFIDYTGLFFIGLLSLGYLLYYRSFAKLHIELSFIKAPFFVGDITFVTCAALFLLKWLINRKNLNYFTYLFLLYCGFVITKTLIGYFNWGPLSLRHAVLFCYPLFAIFSYSFYRYDFFEPKKSIFLVLVFIFILKFLGFHLYSSLTLFILALILINAYPGRLIKYALYFLLLAVFPYRLLFDTSRTFMVGNVFAIVYLSFGFLYVSKIKSKFRFILLFFFLLLVIYGLIKVSRPNELQSLVGYEGFKKGYDANMEYIRSAESTFLPIKLSDIRLFNEEGPDNETIVYNQDVYNQDKEVKERAYIYPKKEISGAVIPVVKSKAVPKLDTEKADIPSAPREIKVAYSTGLFRILIWQDAFRELRMKHPIFGFDFGRPLRSRSLEITGNAAGEWSRDGWICMHNSYIDMVYRAGAVGVLMIVFIIISFFILIRNSLRKRSLTGVLLTAILLNWFVAANFLEILEMPYSAIPLWSLFGLTSAYLLKDKTQ